jgi:hypothetical protein
VTNIIPIQLPTRTITAGSSDPVALKDVPATLNGRLVHVLGFAIEVDFTPTTTALPTTVGNHNILSECALWDGEANRFYGGFNHLRARERLSKARVRVADPDTDTASGSARSINKFLPFGPLHSEYPLDWVFPAGGLLRGQIRLKYGAVTDLAADCTAVSGNTRVTALCVLLDELRVPPHYEFGYTDASAKDLNIPGQCLLESLALLDSSSFGAISAGDFSDISLNLGGGDIIGSVNAKSLAAAYEAVFAPGEVGVAGIGEPLGSLDDNAKIVNRGTPTALTAAPADLQPVWWSMPDFKISKLEMAENIRIRWSGSQTSGVVLHGRILPMSDSTRSAIATRTVTAAGRRAPAGAGGFQPKTLSKRPYRGPKAAFLPWGSKV